MEKFVSILRAGGKTNSLGRASEVLESVLADASLLGQLYDCLFADDAWARMRAADCVEKICRVHPDWIEPYIDRILNDLLGSNQPSIQWHLAQIFAEVRLSDEQRICAIDWMETRISSVDVDWIVSVNTMKTFVQFHRNGFVTKNKIVPLFELQEQHKSKTVRKKAVQFLESL
jgi:hypothetical protein